MFMFFTGPQDLTQMAPSFSSPLFPVLGWTTSTQSLAGMQAYVNMIWKHAFHWAIFCLSCRVVKGMDVVMTIEKSKVDKNDKPFEDIKILSISVLDQAPEGT